MYLRREGSVKVCFVGRPRQSSHPGGGIAFEREERHPQAVDADVVEECSEPLLLPRARIVISGRYNNWEFKADFDRLIDALPITSVTQLDIAGWSAGLKQEDVSWLIEDARDAKTGLRRRLAVDALMGL